MAEPQFKALQNTKPKNHGKVYDKNITFTLGGVKQSIYEYTQAGREDCELYAVIEKYGLDTESAISKISKTPHELYADAREMGDLRSTEDAKIRKEQIWNSIPLKIRNQFGNNPDEFIKNGMEWAQNEIKKAEAQKKQSAPAPVLENKGE